MLYKQPVTDIDLCHSINMLKYTQPASQLRVR